MTWGGSSDVPAHPNLSNSFLHKGDHIYEQKGNDYASVFSAHQVSILDFDLNESEPEFYSTHHLINDKTGKAFTGNFALSVLNLRRIELATDEDISWRIDRWAKLFKADTWEELRMIATEDLEMTNTAKTLYTKNQDETARLWAQAREDFLWREASIIAEAEKAQKEAAKAQEEAAKAQEEAAKAQKEAEKYRALLIANGIDPNS